MAQLKMTNNQLGMTILVQGSVATPEKMGQQIDTFLSNYYRQLSDNSLRTRFLQVQSQPQQF